MKCIFDVGMYDGADTKYYLESGFKVVAVEANPQLIDQASRKFAAEISSGQLTCINAAITADGKAVELRLAGSDLGSSTIFGDRITQKRPVGAVTVPGVTLDQLFEQYSVPEYLKVDIEGADRFCVLSLKAGACPAYLSFEIGDDADELLAHAAKVGYKRFKIINQNSFRELANLRRLSDRIARKLMRCMGYDEPLMIRRAGRFFVSGHSSGPVPWKSDGRWRSVDEARSLLRANSLPGWNDIHATTCES